MKKNTNKKNQIDSIDSSTFLNTIIPSIKVNQKRFPLDDFDNSPSEEKTNTQKTSSLKQT